MSAVPESFTGTFVVYHETADDVVVEANRILKTFLGKASQYSFTLETEPAVQQSDGEILSWQSTVNWKKRLQK